MRTSAEQSTGYNASRKNSVEAELTVNLYLTLRNSCPPDCVPGKVGIVTPYNQQLDELKRQFRRAIGDEYFRQVEISTVDGFQVDLTESFLLKWGSC